MESFVESIFPKRSELGHGKHLDNPIYEGIINGKRRCNTSFEKRDGLMKFLYKYRDEVCTPY